MKKILKRVDHTLERVDIYKHEPDFKTFDHANKIKQNKLDREKRRSEIKASKSV